MALGALKTSDPSQPAERQLTDKLLEGIDRNIQDDQDASTFLSFDMFGSMQCPQELQGTLREIEKGLAKGLKPILTDDGTSGTYLLRGKNKQTLAVFKPIDEEAFAPNNPRDHIGPFGSKTFRAGVLSGEACIREVAAYLIDKDGFSGVPPTTMVETSHESLKTFKFSNFEIVTGCKDFVDMMASIIAPQNQLHNHEHGNRGQPAPKVCRSTSMDSCESGEFLKIGSLQKFVQSNGPLENFSSDLFSKDEVHKIAILDLRIMNLDRNETNILVKVENKPTKCCHEEDAEASDIKSNSSFDSEMSSGNEDYLKILKNKSTVCSLIPIDHSLSIPDTLNVCSYDLIWLSYSQAEEPFSQRSLDFIRSIDVMADISILEKSFKFRPQCLRNMRISSTLLKKGAEAGLTLAQIGQILCRPDEDDEQPSILEQIVKKARTCANMMAQMQTKIKDSQLRLILPQADSNDRRPQRRNSLMIAPQTAAYATARGFDSDDDLDDRPKKIRAQQQKEMVGLAPSRHVDLSVADDPTSATLGPGETLEDGQQGSVETPEKSTLADSGGQEPESSVPFGAEVDIEDENSKQLMQLKKRGYRFNRYNRRTQKKKGKKKKKRNAHTKVRHASAEMMVDEDEAGHARNVKTKPSKKADDLYPVIKQSQTRKRGYSDVDQSNVQALKLNSEVSLSKQCDRKFRVVEMKRVTTLMPTKAGMSKVQREKQAVISKLLSSSSSSSTKSRSQMVKDQNFLFKDFDYRAKQTTSAPNELHPQQEQLGRFKNSQQSRDGSKQRQESQEKFSSAIKRFNDELSWRPQRLLPHKEDAASRFASNIAHLIKSKNPNRRTTSYVDFRISEETDEEDSEFEDAYNKAKADADDDQERCRKISSFKKNSSNVSLQSQSKMSNSSVNNQIFGNTKKYSSGRFQESIGDSKDDKVRFLERRNHEIFQSGSNLYKQRRAKIHLERDMKWNGPHDEEFFRCFEQQLDIAISRIVRQLKIQRNDDSCNLREDSAAVQTDTRGLTSSVWSTPLKNTSLDLPSFNDLQRQSPLQQSMQPISTSCSKNTSPQLEVQRLKQDEERQNYDAAPQFARTEFGRNMNDFAAQAYTTSPVSLTKLNLGNSDNKNN